MVTIAKTTGAFSRKISPLSLLIPSKLKVLLSLGFKGYLAEKGWFSAFQTKSSIDEHGNPIPWVTYSFIDFISDRINDTHDLFEYGSGNSTIFYASRARSVYAVEHNRQWFTRNLMQQLSNVEMAYRKLGMDDAYAKCTLQTDRKFHIIIVDGRDRVKCCKYAVKALSEDGVIVLDDAERPQYAEALRFLANNGFRNIPFSGIAPGVIVSKVTTIFYKEKNCLGI